MSERAKLLEALWTRTRDRLGDTWDELEQAHRQQVEDVLADVADLTLRAAAGEDVDTELAHAKAALASLEYVAVDALADAVRAAVSDVAEVLGGVLKGLVL